MAPKHLVLLPGLDGTGELFADFVAALPESWTATTITYPTDRFLPYTDLRSFVSEAVPQSERFVLVAESFSTPLAVSYAASNPPNLDAVVICAGFVGSPVRGWSGIVKALLKPWLFELRPPRIILEYFLLGQNAPPDLLQKLRHALHRVSPDVLSGRRHARHAFGRRWIVMHAMTYAEQSSRCCTWKGPMTGFSPRLAKRSFRSSGQTFSSAQFLRHTCFCNESQREPQPS